MGFKKGREGTEGLKRLMGAAVAMLYVTGSLVLVNPVGVYVSPDETASAYFADRFAQTFSLRGSVDELLEVFDRLHPRSALVDDGQLVPGSFLGLPMIYGFIAMVVGTWSLWVMTPLLTILAAHGWRRLVARFTSEAVGAMAFVLFLLHPAVWYYSARGLMHNVLFLDLLVLAAWLWVGRPMKARQAVNYETRDLCVHGRPSTPLSLLFSRVRGARQPVHANLIEFRNSQQNGTSVWNDVLAGLCVGLALFVRTSEFAWVAIGLIVAACVWWRTLSWRRLCAGLLGLTVGLGLLLTMNTLTYGHPFTTGYTLGVPSIVELAQNDSIDSVALLPFGFHPMNAWRHFSAYAVTMFWWLSMLTLPGFFLLLAHKTHQRTIRWSILLAACASLWLVFMYGSWEIHDNPDPTQITMANSYVRYWLPLYLFSTPMIAMTLQWLSTRGRSLMSRRLIVAMLVIVVVGLNVNATFAQGQDGLFKMRAELARAVQIQASVLRYTEANSVIVVDRGDKLFFPHRHVWYPLRDEATYAAMPALLESTTLYYYGITLPQADLDYLNGSRLKRMGLGIEPVDGYDDESLYRITVLPSSPSF